MGADEAVELLRRLLTGLQRRGGDRARVAGNSPTCAAPTSPGGSGGFGGTPPDAPAAVPSSSSPSSSSSFAAPTALQEFVNCLEWKLKQLVESPSFSSNLKQSDERRAYREIVSVLAHCDGPDLPLLCEVRGASPSFGLHERHQHPSHTCVLAHNTT